MWNWIEHAPEWDAQWVSLFSRMAKARVRVDNAAGDWTQVQVAALFSHCLRMLGKKIEEKAHNNCIYLCIDV